ncbi:MAG: RluA family pseudouridine synthase [Rikenellaceae bacterium]
MSNNLSESNIFDDELFDDILEQDPSANSQTEEYSDELYDHFAITVDKGQSMMRIDKYLTIHMENKSRHRIQMAADNGNILVNGKAVKNSYKIKPMDQISFVLPYPPRAGEVEAENIPLDILYEDQDILVVNKPAGMVVHPGHGNFSGTLVNAVAYHLQNLPLFQTDNPRPGLVHRIDKNTSGILVMAKTDVAAVDLAKQFFDHSIKRRYVALVWGNLTEDEGTITGHIGRHLKDRLKMTCFPNGEFGKHAVTHYTVLERLGYVNLVECRLETGRTHQIRVHFNHIGHPLFNDERYGGDKVLKGTTFSRYKQFVENCFKIIPRQALHARSLGFIHPTTGEEMYFESPLPEDFSGVIEKWRNYVNTNSQKIVSEEE